MFLCQINALVHGFVYHCSSEFVCDDFVGRLVRRSDNPRSAKALPKNVQRVNLQFAKDILQAGLSHGHGQTIDFKVLARKRFRLFWIDLRQNFLKIMRFHTDPKKAKL